MDMGALTKTDSWLHDHLRALLVGGMLIGASTALNEFVLPPILRLFSIQNASVSFSPLSLTIALLLGSGLTVLVAVTFLSISGRTIDYLDIYSPTLREGGYVVIGIVLNLAASIGVSLVTSVIGLPAGDNSTVDRVLVSGPETALVFVVLAVLLVGPAEELLYRNVVQKRLSEDFNTFTALVFAGGLFALSHVPNVYDPNVVAMISPLLSNWVAGLIYGAVYIRTQSILPAMLTHGFYNAIVVGLAVLGIVGA